jgi:NTP pyrophosphatase (non-canonical NTP hydrolase)
MMLVVSEIGEMVEADRKNRRTKLSGYELDNTLCFNDFVPTFEHFVKDNLEDETADVCIRLFDFLGMKGVEPEVFVGDEWESYFGSMSICEQCYELVQGITIICNDSAPNEISEIAGAMIRFCFNFAEHHGFDLEQHIVWKMKYNNLRAKLHGKSY